MKQKNTRNLDIVSCLFMFALGGEYIWRIFSNVQYIELFNVFNQYRSMTTFDLDSMIIHLFSL